MKKKRKIGNIITTVILSLVSLLYIVPLLIILMNSLKKKIFINAEPFKLPDKTSFFGIQNYINGVEKTDFIRVFLTSLFITVCSVIVILVCTSMCAWFIARVQNKFTKGVYYLCVFSMIVPFQMVMYTLSFISNRLHLTTPWGIIVVYLGFGAGLAVFMFTGFVKSIPIEIEEAAMIDGCNPLQTFFKIVVPILKPTYISVAILEAMWIWNDYLLPSLVLDTTKYQTIPIAVQNVMKGTYGSIDMGGFMAMLVIAIIPIIIFYLCCQKYIIKGVVAGAVKG